MNYSKKDLKKLFPGNWQNTKDCIYINIHDENLNLVQIMYGIQNNNFDIYNQGTGEYLQSAKIDYVKSFYKKYFKFLNFK